MLFFMNCNGNFIETLRNSLSKYIFYKIGYPRVWNSGFGSGRVLPEAQIRSRVGSGNSFLGSGLPGFGYPLHP